MTQVEPFTLKPAEAYAASVASGSVLRRLSIPLAAIVSTLIIATLVMSRWDVWTAGAVVQTTNDAYVRAEVTHLSSRVAAAVGTIAVHDFQRVKAGDLLIQIDPDDYNVQVAQAKSVVTAAKAALANLDGQIGLQNATISQAEAQHLSVQAIEVEARQEQERQQALSLTEAGTRQRLEQAVAAYARAQADVKASTANISAHYHQLDMLASTKQQRAAEVVGAEAALSAAKLRLGYTTILAPFDGVVGERQVQPGNYVNIGSSLIDIVPLPDVYVIANYKETQLTRVEPGQPVDLTVDSFPHQILHGRVQRVSPASGSQFALLPPDNSTGNFTKVVQRIPVRIELEPGQQLIERLLPGMSVTTRIHTDRSAGPRDNAS